MKDAYLLITNDCNNDCCFCSVPKGKKYLTFQEIKKKVDFYIAEQFDQFTLTGGEPLLHPELFSAIKYIKSKNKDCRVVTNGTNLDANAISKLVRLKLDDVIVSLHTLDAAKAKEISNNDEYDLGKVLKNIKAIHRSSIFLNINITLTGMNYKELPDLARYISHNFQGMNTVTINYLDLTDNPDHSIKIKSLSVPLYLAELYFTEAFRILKKNNMNFRAERFPLCYMVGFEEYSSDFNRISKNEELTTDFPDREAAPTPGDLYLKSEGCRFCFYNKHCYGLHPRYVSNYGTKELYPIFQNLKQ